jgi:hypothetical protein
MKKTLLILLSYLISAQMIAQDKCQVCPLYRVLQSNTMQ